LGHTRSFAANSATRVLQPLWRNQSLRTKSSLVNEVAQATLEKLSTVLTPLTKNPVITMQTQEGTVKKVHVSFQVKLSFEIKEE
jgi:hypothetical protein